MQLERRKYKRLSYEDRLRAEKMYKTGMSIAQVAEQLGVTRSTIYRDYKRGVDNRTHTYSAELAQQNLFR
ncbi:helix-turn-helix domain-containing protein [Eubacterium sp. An11]|uniref:helix-turn-helix domain-containing protein n=1 Tax=Eubacterium sp. An11 TaxID=1965542 RepID=UPI0023BA3072|nr:helix-turn-helix domain-containing protein [Eubacterium sp. An11]